MKNDGVVHENYIRYLSHAAADKKQFGVGILSQTERDALLRENSRLRRDGWPAGTVPHESVARRTLDNLFLPALAVAEECLLWGCRPSDIAEEWPGFSTEQTDVGWTIGFDGEVRNFPFWSLSPDTPLGWALVLSCKYESARQTIESILCHTFNPFVVSNPRASPVFRKCSAAAKIRGGRVWLNFNLNTMRLDVIASKEHCSRLCETSLRDGNIVAPYQGLLWDDSTTLEYKPAAKTSRRYRYSGGRLPPASALERFPNWMPALDEEGIRGQDETTIRPDDEQRFVGEFTAYTSADAEFADGRTVPALLGQPDATFLHKGEVDVVVVYEGRRRWTVDVFDGDGRWEPATKGPTRKAGDDKIFPLRVRSRLPLGGLDGPHLARILRADGSVSSRDRHP